MKHIRYWALAGAAIALRLALAASPNARRRRAERRIERLQAAGGAACLRSVAWRLGAPVTQGNRIEELHNGVEIFPAMLEAIRAAQHSITFETYIYWSGETGRTFASALSERARAGVRVHVLLDWAGSIPMDEALIDCMLRGGAEVRRFHKPRLPRLAHINNRTHRKLMVVDGRVGFTGGVGIADHWQGDAQGPGHWRDSHFRVRGPVVAQMQQAFLDNWTSVTGTGLDGPAYFPPLSAEGDQPAHVFSSSPRRGSESMHLMFMLMVAAARETIDLATAYFVPDSFARRRLIEAVQRGVRVRILMPGEHIDMGFVRRASRALWEELLECGVEIHEFQPTMYHVKALIVDRRMVSIGSANFDNRSFILNDEANLNVYDPALAGRLTEMFEHDLRRSRRITVARWRQRPLEKKLIGKLAWLMRSEL